MSDVQQRLRRRQRIEGLATATMRALTGYPALQYRGRRLYAGDTPLPAPAPHLRIGDDADLAAWRGVADARALRLLYSDGAQHAARRPEPAIERLVFDWLEQLRVEALAPAYWPGLTANLVARFQAWSLDYHRAGLTEGEIGELLYAVMQICWSQLTGRPALEATESILETRRGEIAPFLGHAVAGIRRERANQAAFAEHALAIAAFVGEHAPPDLGQRDNEDDDDSDRAAFSVLLDFEEDAHEGFAAALSGDSEILDANDSRYRVFTTAYDVEWPVERCVRSAQLQTFRKRLDVALGDVRVNSRRLARYLRQRLSTPVRDVWQFGEEAGLIDGRRLAHVVASPAERGVFKIEADTQKSDAVVGVLIDCSGSMKAHGEFLALVIDRLMTALDLAGIDSEILGFTTSAWSGGRAHRDWLAAGRPAAPGRLNERRHLVFKPATTRWRRARRSVGALLKADLFREGVDGEGVDWACSRLLAREARRRILIVVSDGCPADSATHLANDRFYLDNHLKQVLARREAEGAVDVRGLGIGLDLSPFYRRSLIVDPAAPIDNATLTEIAALVAEPR